jgi:hypothetical protein
MEHRMGASTTRRNIVLTELGRRPWLTPPRAQRPKTREPRESLVPRRAELASARFLSEREARGRWIAALTIEDQFADRYFAIYHLTEHAVTGWEATGSFLGPDRILPGKPDLFLSLGAFCADGVFCAGGRTQDEAAGVARVELAWDDGQTLSDRIENGVALFLGNRDTVDPATVSFYRKDGTCAARHRTLTDDHEDPPQPPDTSYTRYLRDIGEKLTVLAEEARAEAAKDTAGKPERAAAAAYSEISELMQRQAATYGLDLADLGLTGSHANRDSPE